MGVGMCLFNIANLADRANILRRISLLTVDHGNDYMRLLI
ncbi:uncharacterized protein G2W53_008239 [Senna tora]|uniref:Uncharacterized protein n=1 Tax=Senna tora TaxID=362788 RepID=A0A834X8C7_9FABA|nr:uncharacterized protein G2W53_008239 [Senna tora]